MDPLEAQMQYFVDQAAKVAVPDQETKKKMTEAGAKVLTDALKEVAPVSKRKEEKYGHLKDNIAMDNKDIDGTDNGNAVVGFHKKAYIARFLNDGTIKMSGTHWVDKTRRDVSDKVFEAEHKVLDEQQKGGDQ